MSATLIHQVGLEQTPRQASTNNQPDVAAGSLRNQVKYTPAGARRTYKSPIDQVTFLLTGEQTDGAFLRFQNRAPIVSGEWPGGFHEC